MKIWLDDVRPAPSSFDVHCTNAASAIQLLMGTGDDKPTYISFDHDLGDDENGTGYDVAKFIEKMAYEGLIGQIQWAVHSANPVGRTNIRAAMKSAEHYWGIR